ncbi:MAG: protoporphyrinogen oxidase [Ilumatobacteraceae bacterium]
MTDRVRIAVVGAGIAGLTTALDLAETDDVDVTVFDRANRVGGRIGTSPFAGVDHVDEGADAFLARVPEAIALAERVGLGDELVSPEPVGAAVWYDGLHPIPDGLLLGLPGRLGPLARTGLLSWRGKARAAIEPLLPRTSTDADSIGAFVRSRFGDEVHERLVDSLVGSIYATDTDNSSLAEVPQLAAVASGSRSVLLAARRQRRTQAGTATAAASPVFASPRHGIGSLVDAVAEAATAAGATIHTGTSVDAVVQDEAGRWTVHASGSVSSAGAPFDAVVFATPADVAAASLRAAAPDAAELLAQAERADVVMVTLHVPADEWPTELRGLSGYLVPKPVQRLVTAASFGSQKWAHWRPPGGGEILRVSLGRDGAEVMHLTDDEILDGVLADLSVHLGVTFHPLDVRVSRWPGAFAQYRPHHRAWVDRVEQSLPDGVFVTGAAYRGIGIPACVRAGTAVAGHASAAARRLAELNA